MDIRHLAGALAAAGFIAAVALAPDPPDVVPRDVVPGDVVQMDHVPNGVRIAMQPVFYDEAGFVAALRQAEEAVPAADIEKDISAIVVPHHLLASSMIAETFRRASGREIETVVIVGPNHDKIGPAPVVSANGSWPAAAGAEVPTDPILVGGLLSTLQAPANPEAFRAEHSVGAIVPFAHHFFPQAKIVPIIVRPDAPRDSVERLSGWLAGLDSEKTLIVFSIDFSHYLARPEAEKMDVDTRKVIEADDAEAAIHMGGAHFDSPPTLATALRLAKMKTYTIRILDHGNSNDFLAAPLDLTTSYFTVAIGK